MTVNDKDLFWCDVVADSPGVYSIDLCESCTLRDVIVMGVHEERFLHVQVTHDTNYPGQSRATAKVWRPQQLDWSPVSLLLSHAWADQRDRHIDGATEGAWVAVDLLRERAFTVLGVE